MRVRMPFMKDERGFAAPAAAVALLLSCSLLFAGVHGYVVSSRSGQIQYVADAGALAADNVVARYVVAGQAVDALLLSCSLLAVCTYAASAVAAFIPGAQGFSVQAAAAGKKVLTFRDKAAKKAQKGLDKAAKALPALCAVAATECIQANASASGIAYTGTAVAFPSDMPVVKLASADEAQDALDDVEEQGGEVQEKAAEREKAAQELDAAKEEAWRYDCGASGMSMRERAGKLAGLSGAANPSYSTVDSWSFKAPLERAKAYYRARCMAEPAEAYAGSPELISESVARKRFYKYALEEVSKGSVGTSSSGGELPNLKLLARNTQQIKQTWLYTESIYPVSQGKKGKLTIHAYSGCPVYARQAAAGAASARDVDAGQVQRCDTCKFSAATLGRVPAASTSIDNGFEYYYRKVVEASQRYKEKAQEASTLDKELGKHKDAMEKDIQEALSSLAGARYDPQPPGRYGCVCIVYAPDTSLSALPFVAAGNTLPARVALSAATLAPDEQDDAGDAVSDIAQGLLPQDAPGSGVLHSVLGAWGSALKAYAGGTQGVKELFRSLAASIPVVGTDLSAQVSDGMDAALSAAGLEPADLTTYKPVVVNSSHVLAADGGATAQALLRAKSTAAAYGAASVGDLEAFASSLGDLEGAGAALSDDGLTILESPTSVFGSGCNVGDIVMSAPSDLASRYEDARSALQGVTGS